ncbi:pilus assembly protein TadG-related protein [Henriciella sp.]|uniref:vWA domain-containing protein n=1 Tax=Henriciella sp. TaxID=1968823 RepID=UPI002606B423|nr:pilus assembly protein TadG-related protein [Henriciella sp.]
MTRLKRATSFKSEERGNVAMIFAITLVPLLVVAGFAIDAQLAFSKKDKIQYAIDSAVLAGARMMQSTNDEDVVRKHARDYFEAIMANEDQNLDCDTLNIIFSGPEELTGNVTCHQPTTLMRIVGHDNVDIGSSSTATYGTGRVDVAFVFDVSGSMNNYGRIYDLKDAAKEAAETLLPQPGSASDGDVRIAMVAYNSMINADKYFEEVTGLEKRRTYQGEDHYEQDASKNKKGAEEKCDWVCTSRWGCWGRWGMEYKCRWVVGETDTQEKTINDTCVYERDGDHAFDNTQPTQLAQWDLIREPESGAFNASEDEDNEDGFLAASHTEWRDSNDQGKGGSWDDTGVGECPDAGPFGLSHNRTQINHYIDSLRAGGGTAGHQGIAWGWYLISHEWRDVFTGNSEPLDPSEPDVVKAMIMMTDGEFNRQFFNSQGSSDDQAEALCDAIKDDDVIIYTVAFQAPPAGKEILRNCASGPEFYFNAENGQELVESYNAIATSISDLRISH